MKLKKIIQESAYLGELPSAKLMKMKWNPVTEDHVPGHDSEDDVADQDHKGDADDLPPQDAGLEEAAPKIKKDKKVEQLKTVRQIASGVEAQIKTMDSSRYSHVKNDFNKFRKAMDNLISALNRKGATIPK